MTIKAKQTLVFNLEFMPKVFYFIKDVRDYVFNLTLNLFGLGKIKSLERQVLCKGKKPKFIMRPN